MSKEVNKITKDIDKTKDNCNSVLDELKNILEGKSKGFQVTNKVVYLLINLEKEIFKFTKETDKNIYNLIEDIIFKTISSDLLPIGVLLLKRAIHRCCLALYSKNKDLITKKMKKLETFLEELSNSKETASQISYIF
jgi:hypothetical protein